MAKPPAKRPQGPAFRGDVTAATQDIPVTTSRPDEIRRHNISDEQLEMLANTKHDHLSEVMWAAIGAACSAAPAALADIHGAYWVKADRAVPLSGYGLFEVSIFMLSAAAAAMLIIVVAIRGKKAHNIVDIIRSQGT